MVSSSYSKDRLEPQAPFLASKQTLLYWVTQLVALAVSQPGWIHTLQKEIVWTGNLHTETFVLHSKLSQAQRLDLGVVCITDQRKSFLCQFHLVMASSLHLSENKQCKKGANPGASAALLLGQKGQKKSTLISVFRPLDGYRFSRLQKCPLIAKNSLRLFDWELL